MHRPIHDYVECIYSNSMLPSIYKPTRITANTATCIDNILTNNVNIIQTAILVNDTSDHMPTILLTNLVLSTPKSMRINLSIREIILLITSTNLKKKIIRGKMAGNSG